MEFMCCSCGFGQNYLRKAHLQGTITTKCTWPSPNLICSHLTLGYFVQTATTLSEATQQTHIQNLCRGDGGFTKQICVVADR